MPPYNSLNDFYLRQPQPFQNYPNQFGYSPQQPQIKSHYVSNIEEAKASMIDPLSVNLFIDTASGKIYMKRMSNNGISEFYEYIIEEAKKSDPIQEINNRLTNIENVLGGIVNVQSVSNDESTSTHSTEVTRNDESNGSTEPTAFSKNEGNDYWKKRK